MANYRPKSLNELNNLYDKSMAAQNAIKKKGSAIADANSIDKKESVSSFPEEITPNEKSPSQIASDELSEALSGFMKSFGEPDAAKEKPTVRQPLPITKAVKPTISSPSKQNKAEEAAEPAPSQPQTEKKEKPILMRNAERTELLDDYMKIMNDEDDDVAYLKNIIKKKKKGKKDKHQGSPLFEQENGENENSENSEISEDEQPADEKEQDIINEDESKEQESFESFYSDEEAEEESEDPEEELSEQNPGKPKKKRKNLFLQLILMLVLLAVLASAVCVGLLKVVVGVDSGNTFMEKYCVFTAEEDFTKAGISKGDLVITEKKELAENDAFAYADSYGSVIYALKGTQIGTDRFMAHYDGEVDLIDEADVKGAVIKTVPSAGNFVGLLMDNFIIILSVLVAAALILILILALAFKSKSNYDIDDSEYSEPSDEDESVEEDFEEGTEAEEDVPFDEDDDNLISSEADREDELFETID